MTRPQSADLLPASPASTTSPAQHPASSGPAAGRPDGGQDAGGRSRSRPRREHREHGDRSHPTLDAPGPSPSHEPEIPEDRLDADAIRVIARLRHAGHQAYFVGGCVRDVLLGKTPKDFDVATSAHPGEVRATFRNCRLIGRRFRLAHVYFRGGKVIEVATFRQNPTEANGAAAAGAEDAAAGPGDDADLLITRDNVFGTAEEDAVRRDFTVNGLFYDVFAGEVIDYVGGRADLEAHRIATIGDPEIRMREDPVRALRAVRFASRLGFTIEPETFAAMRRHAGELARCAPPRLLEELFKILRCGASARAFELLRSSGALQVLLPALGHVYDGSHEEGRRHFLAHLAALDRLVRAGEDPSEAVLLGALLLHLPEGEPGGPSERDRLLAEFVATARLPRRIAERTRLALTSQRAFHGQQRRRRRGLSHQAYFTDAVQLLEITVHATGQGGEILERWRAEATEDARHGGHDRDRGDREERGAGRGHGHEQRARPPVAEDQPAGEGGDLSLERRPHAAPQGQGVTVVEVGPAASGEGRRRRRHRGGRRRRRRGGGGDAAGGPPAPQA